jgi:hypothetical protein
VLEHSVVLVRQNPTTPVLLRLFRILTGLREIKVYALECVCKIYYMYYILQFQPITVLE